MPDWIEIIVRTLAAITILFLMTKVLGKRQISELSLFEYITGISIGNIAAYISLDLDELWYLGIVSLLVWVSASVGIEYLTMKNKKARDIVDGKGRVLIKDGKLLKEQLKKERLTLDELLEQLRSKDVYRVADVEFAVMESSGELNVLMKKQYQPITPDMLGWKMAEEKPPHTLVMDGIVLEKELELSGVTRDWLRHKMSQQKLKLEEVLLAQLDSDGITLHIQMVDGRSFPQNQAEKPADRIRQMTAQLEEELKRLEHGARNEADRQAYRSALDRLQTGLNGK
ncbi:DUF421 domain-containing protein [Paenibacillus sp. PAMC21692]|uniref:DUF421 domain-containing protein n=1 Tax=Paenibacillus sp. PAMC21692 TaxID=2762320 RepID=UPI00164D843B|nr:DUF421 domain-containing protein [Paenibacillus sp. PAMC21692]QNK59349.1 DUF421 domain-containing protein [Paenibacillus sp. PAMC21692]